MSPDTQRNERPTRDDTALRALRGRRQTGVRQLTVGPTQPDLAIARPGDLTIYIAIIRYSLVAAFVRLRNISSLLAAKYLQNCSYQQVQHYQLSISKTRVSDISTIL